MSNRAAGISVRDAVLERQTRISAEPAKGGYVRYGTVLLLYAAFAVFICTLPFEEIPLGPLGLIQSYFSLSKLAGMILCGCAVLLPRLAFRQITPEMYAFAVYILVFLGFGLVQGTDILRGIISRGITMGLCLLLMWISFSLLQREKTASMMLFCVAASNVALALTVILVGGYLQGGANRRLTASGVDPNILAALLCVGIVACVGLAFERKSRSSGWVRFSAVSGAAVMVAALIPTGSRGAVLAMVLGLTVLFLGDIDRWRSLTRFALTSKVRILALIVVGLTLLALFSAFYEPVRERWVSTFTAGSMAGRERIWPEAIGMITESPVYGWGPIKHWEELGQRTGRPLRDPHSLYISLFTEGGIVGATPFLLGILLLVIRGLQARKTIHGTVPLALLVSVLAINLSMTWQLSKMLWLVMGYVAACGMVATKRVDADSTPYC